MYVQAWISPKKKKRKKERKKRYGFVLKQLEDTNPSVQILKFVTVIIKPLGRLHKIITTACKGLKLQLMSEHDRYTF